MEIVSDNKNILFARREIEAKLGVHGHTPSRKEITVELAKKLDCDAKCISIRKIEHKYGRKVVGIQANIYLNAATLEKNEPKHHAIRTHGKKAEEKKAA